MVYKRIERGTLDELLTVAGRSPAVRELAEEGIGISIQMQIPNRNLGGALRGAPKFVWKYIGERRASGEVVIYATP